MNSIPTALRQGYSIDEVQDLTDSFVNEYLDPIYDDLYEYVENNIAFDNDDYFARAIQFFGNAYLSVNELDLGYTSILPEHINYIRNNMLLSKVDDPANYTLKDNNYNFKETYPDDKKGFTPSLDLFIRHASSCR